MENLFLNQQENINVLNANEDEFEKLLALGKVSEAISRMDNLEAQCLKAFNEYDPHKHKIAHRPDKIKQDKRGNVVGKTFQAKLPIPYQQYINEVALVFLFGRPIMWQQESQQTDDAFSAFLRVIDKTRFNAKIRQCKRIAGAETESAMLFRTYLNDENKASLQLRVLAHSKGDEIYTRFDQYDNLISFGWGYYVKDANNSTEYHIDVFTKKNEYLCVQKEVGWQVDVRENLVGKIPIILFRQQKEWAGVEPLIEREEYIASHAADTNDYFADPILIASADVIRGLPEKQEAGKMFITNDTDGGVDKALKYITWDSAPASRQAEVEWLQSQILSKTFTPDIKLDTLKSLGNLSGKALRTVMLLADIKAGRNKETYDEMLDRTASLLTTIIGNVLDVSLKTQCEKLRIKHVWQEPFGEDVAEALDNIIKAVDGNILSEESAIGLNPLVSDTISEKQRLEDEQKTRQTQQDMLFNVQAASYDVRGQEGGNNNQQQQQQVN